MSVPQYPLEQIIEIKERRLDEAEKFLNEKKRILEKEKEKLQKLEDERDQILHHRTEKLQQIRQELDKGPVPSKIEQMKVYLKTVEEKLRQAETKVKEQERHVENAQKEVEIARKVLIQRQKDIEKISLHKKEWSKQELLEIGKQEALELGEIGDNVFLLQKRKKRGQK